MATADNDSWTDRARAVLAGYDETLLRYVTGTLVKPRTPVPLEELAERCLATLNNPPVVDRRIRELPQTAQKALTILGQTRQPRWKVGHLVTLLSAIGHSEGLLPLRQLFDAGMLFPDRPADAPPLPGFEPWLNQADILHAYVFTLPAVAARAREESLGLADFSNADGSAAHGVPRIADGLEWPLRVAAACQLAADNPFRLTIARALFKRDLGRLQTVEVLATPPSDHLLLIPDMGVLCLYWAAAVGQLESVEDELRPATAAEPPANLIDAIIQFTSALTEVEAWDPLLGYAPREEGGLSPFPSAAVLTLLLLASSKGWVEPRRIAEYMWENHPSWQGSLSRESARLSGLPWVEAFLFGLAYTLRLVEVTDQGGRLVRLSDIGRHVFAGGPLPAPPQVFPQTLMVQPNAEILAYRQGLTPLLIARLSRFARWKAIGPACTLELTADQTYRGLESGLTLSGIVQTLNQHGTRPVPPAVADLLQRWANKRERISVYASATLVEFQNAADLDAAISRGVVAVRVTDRLGLCSDGGDPDYKALRLTGNRDYDARPSRCLTVADDGVTLTVDMAASDLLLEADIIRLGEPVVGDAPGLRRFRLTPALLRKAIDSGWPLEELDSWFIARTGNPLPAAGRLFVMAANTPPLASARRLVVTLPNSDMTDGLLQWPGTRPFVEDRLGPTAVIVDEENYGRFVERLAEIGVKVKSDC